MEDCVKVYSLDDVRPKLLDVILKSSPRRAHDICATDSHIFIAETDEAGGMIHLGHIETSEINTNPAIQVMTSPVIQK